jgi:tetraacyldisaccharide 4'-kinase
LKKLLLLLLTVIYCPVNFLWDLYWRIVRSEKISSRVISVGNITVGGSGKTSLAEYIASTLSSGGVKTAVVTRGYRRPSSSSLEICDTINHDWESCGDEAAALARSIAGLKIYVDSSKTYAASKASDDGHEVVIIDDGFQHRRLARDLDIVCIDGANPFGNGWLLPYGILREPIRSLKRADAFVVFIESTNIPDLSLPAGKPVFKVRKKIKSVETGNTESMDLKGKKVVGFCGTANPDSFHNTLENTGADIVVFEKYKDHYIYKSEDIKRILDSMETADAEFAVTTLKDFVKLEKIWPDDKKLCYIKINLDIDNEEGFIRLIRDE